MDAANSRLKFSEEISKNVDAINDLIKKYNIVEPSKNVCTMWEDGKLVICFSQSFWPDSDK